jgi:hypothetical protein
MSPVRSQNGFECGDEYVATYTVSGSSRRITTRKGSAGVIVIDFFGFIHNEVESLEGGAVDDASYAFRKIAGSSSYSNHASATAGDANWRKHPQGKANTWTVEQRAKLHARRLLYTDPVTGLCVVRLGMDYHGTVDDMHFELLGPANGVPVAAIVRVADLVREGRLGHGAYSYPANRPRFRATAPAPIAGPTLHLGDRNSDVGRLQRELAAFMERHHSSYAHKPTGPIDVDSAYGPQTERFVAHAKAMLHYQVQNQQGDNATADFRHNLRTK